MRQVRRRAAYCNAGAVFLVWNGQGQRKKPRINITVLDAENLREITLCWDCERKLTDWLGISLAEDDNGEDDK